jgi:hypothetical protein
MNDKYLMIDPAFPNPILECEGLVLGEGGY